MNNFFYVSYKRIKLNINERIVRIYCGVNNLLNFNNLNLRSLFVRYLFVQCIITIMLLHAMNFYNIIHN